MTVISALYILCEIGVLRMKEDQKVAEGPHFKLVGNTRAWQSLIEQNASAFDYIRTKLSAL